MSSSSPRGSWDTAPRYTDGNGQPFSLQLRLVVFVVFAGGATLLFTVMLLQDIWKCFTMGCSALLPMRIRWIEVPMPVHVHIAFDGGMLLFLLSALWMGYNELLEKIREQQAQKEFEEIMQRVRSGEDIDGILADLKKRKER